MARRGEATRNEHLQLLERARLVRRAELRALLIRQIRLEGGLRS